MTTMHINTVSGVRDLIDLAREIEAVEHQPRRLALRLAISRLEDYLIDVESDQRYVPVGMTSQPWTSWTLPPIVFDVTSPLLTVGP